MIGIFDSGYGGLTILHTLIEKLPEYSYMYLGDNKRAPYGNLEQEKIREYTTQGVDYLLKQGCEIVILACNTASAESLRKIQQEWLPKNHPDKRVLGILTPTVEQTIGDKSIGILATKQTVETKAYEREIKKRSKDTKVIQQACDNLAQHIEENTDKETIQKEIKTCVQELLKKSETLDAVLLGCTHYELVADEIQKELPEGTKMYEQPVITAQALKQYLENHPEIEKKIKKGDNPTFLTTGDADKASKNSTQWFGKQIEFKKIEI